MRQRGTNIYEYSIFDPRNFRVIWKNKFSEIGLLDARSSRAVKHYTVFNSCGLCVCVCGFRYVLMHMCNSSKGSLMSRDQQSYIYIYIASTYAVTRKVLLMKRRALLAHYGTIYTFDCDGAMRCVLSPDQNVLRALVIWYYGYRYFVGITHEMIPYYIIFWIGGGGRLRAIRDRVTLHQTFVFVGARLMGIRNVSSCGVNGGNSANHSVNAFKQSFIL